jgi:glycosyltransferase involved in cell wall biosynthesis
MLSITESLGLGGAERALVYLLPALQARGFQCEVAALWPPYTLASELEVAGIVVHRLNIRPKLNFIAAATSIARLARNGGYDILHAHVFFAAFYTALSRPLAPKPRRAVTFHNLAYDSYPTNNLKRKALKAANTFLMRNFIDAHLAVSPAVAEHYSRHLGIPSIPVLPNAVSIGKIPDLAPEERRAIRARYGIGDDPFLLLMAGRFVHEKGHRFLLEALSILRGRGITPRVLMIGSGPEEQSVRQQVTARAVQDLVTVSPSIPHPDLLKVMQASDAFVIPSTHEGFPLTPAEAMLLGKPVIASAVGGLPSIVQHDASGILVPPANPIALADAIARMIETPDLRMRLGETGKKRVEAEFSLAALVPKWEDLYAEMMARSEG